MGNSDGQIQTLQNIGAPLHNSPSSGRMRVCGVLYPRVARNVGNDSQSLVGAEPGLVRTSGLDVVVELAGQAPFLAEEAPPVPAVIAAHSEVGRDPEHLINVTHACGDDVDNAVIPVEFDFYALMDDIEAMFRLRTAEKHLALEMTMTGEVPRLIYADSAKIREVVINLLGNAVKFTENGAISVGISSLASSKDGRDCILAIEVKDTGYGIAPEELDRAFEPFEQTHSGRCQVGGTGLGLPISREYARMMGGDLVVESSLGKGSTFRFTFRARAADEDGAARVGTSTRQVTGLVTDCPPKVLVVDDDEASREALALHLSLVGFCVREAANGVEAVAAFDEWRPAAILMDLWMPEMDGLEAIRRIKATPEGMATPILTVTASVLEKSEQEAMAAGSDGFVRKPFAKAEVFNQLKRVLGIEYVYEKEPCPSGKERAAQAQPVSLPDGLVRELSEATECGDGVGLRRLVEEHRGVLGQELAGRLTDLANHYEYDKVMELLGRRQTCGR